MCHIAHPSRKDGQPPGSRVSNQVARSPWPLGRIKQSGVQCTEEVPFLFRNNELG